MSDLHPTITMGVEGEVRAKAGTQEVAADNKEDTEEMEKHSRNASAGLELSSQVFVTDCALRVFSSLMSNFVLLSPTKCIFWFLAFGKTENI